MKRTSPSIGSSSNTRVAERDTGDHPTTPALAQGSSAADAARSHRSSLKSRLLSCLGMTPSSVLDRSNESPATAADGFSSGGGPGTLAGRILRRSNRDTEMLADSIRGQIRNLPPPVAERFEGQLANALQRNDAKGRLSTLNMLEKNVSNAVKGARSGLSGTAAPLQRTIPTNQAPAPAQKPRLVAVRFEGAEAQLTHEQEQQILKIRFGILKLPEHQAAQYRTLLSDVIATGDSAKLSHKLRQMSDQIDEHLAS